MTTGRHKTIIVEGIIGAGKSVLAQELAKSLGPETLMLLEPDERDKANPYLGLFYGDPPRWAFTMQVHLLGLRYRMQLRAQWHAMNAGGHAVCDRSYYGDTCFARMLNASGAMSEDEYNSYRTLYQAMTASVLLPNVCVRILVHPEVAAERVAKRMEQQTGRKVEKGIDLQYLQALDEQITHMVDVLRGRGVMVLDMPWDVDRDTPEQREVAVRSLASRIEGLAPRDALLDMHRRTT